MVQFADYAFKITYLTPESKFYESERVFDCDIILTNVRFVLLINTLTLLIRNQIFLIGFMAIDYFLTFVCLNLNRSKNIFSKKSKLRTFFIVSKIKILRLSNKKCK